VPTYQYACTECGHDFEVVQSFSDASLTECPVCAGRLRKVFNAVGIVFKGSGFYRTDSRNGAGKDGAQDGAQDGSKDGAKDGSKDKAEKTPGADKPATAGKDGGSSTPTPASKPGSSSGNGSSGASGSGSSPAATTSSKAGSAA
jgi:putative FmdB family regulatory protein